MPSFKGVLSATPRGGGGTLVPIPRQVAANLGLKGMPKVQAVIAGQPYRGSLMPMGDGTYCLGVLKSIQEAAGGKQGDTVTGELGLDTAPRLVEGPADLAKAIARDKKATPAWEAPSYPNKKGTSRSPAGAHQTETRKHQLGGAPPSV